jgi:hypothetical protein
MRTERNNIGLNNFSNSAYEHAFVGCHATSRKDLQSAQTIRNERTEWLLGSDTRTCIE